MSQLAIPETLDVCRSGQVLSVSDSLIDHLGDVNVPTRIAVSDIEHGQRIVKTRESLLLGKSHSGGTEVIANAGLSELLLYKARRSGARLAVVSESPIAQLPDPVEWPILQDRWLVDFVCNNERGLIRTLGRCDIGQWIEILFHAFSGKRIMVVGRAAELSSIARRLHVPHALVTKSGQLQLSDDDDYPRLAFCTPMSAADLESEKCDIVLMLDALQCDHAQMQWLLIQPDARFRLFGFLNGARRLKPYEQATLHRVFGFRVLDVLDQRLIRRPTHYAWVRQTGGGTSQPDSNPYTYNHARNDQICRLAKKLPSHNLSGNKYRDVRKWLRQNNIDRPSVAVVVDRLDHAVELGRHLRDWTIWARADYDLRGIPRQIRERIEDRSMLPDLQQMIIVADDREELVCNSDVMVWASGGQRVGIPDRWLYSPDPRPCLIVDFLDEFGHLPKQKSYTRRSNLEQRDIFRVGTPDHIGRIESFLRTTGGHR